MLSLWPQSPVEGPESVSNGPADQHRRPRDRLLHVVRQSERPGRSPGMQILAAGRPAAPVPPAADRTFRGLRIWRLPERLGGDRQSS
jgi:hypothetical protein